MATLPPSLPNQPWVCPHCHAQWHTVQGKCMDCGYGLAGVGARPQAGVNGQVLQPQAPAASSYGELASMMREVEEQRLTAAERGVATPYEAQLSEDLQRSLAAESQLQAELAPLRERVVQLEAQRGQLLGGVQAMLQPLQQWRQAHGFAEVPSAQLIGATVGLLDELLTVIRKQTEELQHPAQSALQQQMLDEIRQVKALLRPEGPRVEAPRSVVAQTLPPVTTLQGPGPEPPYPTWIPTDQGQAQLERALLEEQTRRGGMAYGRE